MAIYAITKIQPILLKTNNYVVDETGIVQQFKFLIVIEAFLGINKGVLLHWRRIILILCNIYCIFLVSLFIYNMILDYGEHGTLLLIIKYAPIVEHILFSFILLITRNDKIKNVFQMLHAFDEKLNIQSDLDITSSSKKIMFFTLFSFFCNLIENILFSVIGRINYTLKDYISQLIVMLTTLTHDLEQIFFFSLFRCIYMRVLTVKAHVIKLFKVADRTGPVKEKITEAEKLSKRANLDISALHDSYKMLFDCVEELNSAMSFPVSNVMLSKKFFDRVGEANEDLCCNSIGVRPQDREQIILCSTYYTIFFFFQMMIMFFISGATTTILLRFIFIVSKNEFDEIVSTFQYNN